MWSAPSGLSSVSCCYAMKAANLQTLVPGTLSQVTLKRLGSTAVLACKQTVAFFDYMLVRLENTSMEKIFSKSFFYGIEGSLVGHWRVSGAGHFIPQEIRTETCSTKNKLTELTNFCRDFSLTKRWSFFVKDSAISHPLLNLILLTTDSL